MGQNSLYDIAAFSPKSLEIPNAWVGNLPFAAWLIQEFSPKIFVELGTHSGNSYFTFCQSVAVSGGATRCYAVDTWQGDEHAGQYKDDVFNKVNEHNQKHYAEFSQLLRMTFDNATDLFTDGAVELLHIDGLHTYEAVRHDFESWLPKLAPGAVVMFHDTNVRERNFGVWELWAELQARYPNNLEFVHSHGLGVLQLNDAPDEKKLQWLRPGSSEKQVLINYFAALGSKQLESFNYTASLKQAVTEREWQISSLTQIVAERDQWIAILQKEAAAHTAQGKSLESLNELLAERNKWIAILQKEVAASTAQGTSLQSELAGLQSEVAGLQSEVLTLKEQASRLGEEIKGARQQIIEIKQSTSWRLTLPLREARSWIANPKQQAERYAKWGLRLAKRMCESLPFTAQAKARFENVLTKDSPKLIMISGSHSKLSEANLPSIEQAPKAEVLTLTEFAKAIAIPLTHDPIVSIIIPVYGEIDYTLRCLASIAANPAQVAFEVIVVDDCSPDNSADILAQVNGVCLMRNEQNQGFIRSCNAGARVAQGEFLYFLNNDTEVTPGWIDELVRTFDEFPGTGFVGSKLVYPDGRLQEAGGIVWQDASAWNFGRYQDPRLPIYNYAREVDYCSGASIMVPKALFDELGGFDEHYLPAYCEDCDLALKIRDKGYRVIYQPLSTVVHYEGVTSGTDTSQGTKAYQVENTKKLYERWKSRLQTHQPAGTDVDNAKDRCATRRVLVIDHCTPTANQDAGSLITFNMMLLLREMNFQVTFIPENNFLYQTEYTTALQRAGIEMLYAPYVTSVEQHIKKLGNRYALVFLFRPNVFELHFNSIRRYCPQAKVLFHTVDLHFLRMSREAALQSDETKYQAGSDMKRLELSAICASHASIVVSTAELELLRIELPTAKLHVFPLVMDIKGTKRQFASRRDIVFVGGYQHAPNIDAVKYFVAQVMPLLRKRLPGVRFYVVGSKTPVEIQALACEDVVISGFVDDLGSLLDKMRVSVAPIRYGAGIKGKIGSAMAVGLPVVATPLAAEGMSLLNGETILVAEGEEPFAEAIAKLYQDESLWNQISQNGLIFAEKTWGAEAAWQALSVILGDMGFTTGRNAYPLSLYSHLNVENVKNKQ